MHGRDLITILMQADTNVIGLVQGLEANHYASVVPRHGKNLRCYVFPMPYMTSLAYFVNSRVGKKIQLQ